MLHIVVKFLCFDTGNYCVAGDLMDEDAVLDFLTSLESMDLPDRIEEVNAKILDKIVEDNNYVAVLFCESFLAFFHSTFVYSIYKYLSR